MGVLPHGLADSNDFSHMMFTTKLASLAHVLKHAMRSTYTMTGRVRSPNQFQQLVIFNRTVRNRFVQPCIKSSLSNAQNSTHCDNTKPLLMLVNELLLYSGWLAKYLAPLFKMSRFSSVRRSWEHNFKVSLLASRGSFLCCSVSEGFAVLPHL